MAGVRHHLPVETHLKGVPLSPGIALGRACFYERRRSKPDLVYQADSRQEIQRLRHSLRWLARQRLVLAHQAELKLGQEQAEIFEAHRLMLLDEFFQSQLTVGIEENGYSAEQAVQTVLNLYKQQLAATDSEYLQQRVADISEIQQGLLGHLNRENVCRHCKDATGCSLGHCRLGNDHILIGEEITANLPIETDHNTIGFIVAKGGPNSHAIILARALRCPVVGGIQDLPVSIPLDAQILVDGDSGEVILNPTQATLARYQFKSAGRRQNLEASTPVPGLKVMANIGQSGDVDDALACGAEGVGLYRTEMELLVAGRLLNKAEQFARYSDVVRAMAGRPVCIRLLDLGNDKTAEWLDTILQGAALTGLRGARLLLAQPELLREQARALARASSHGPIQVLYPMISSVEQFIEMRALFGQAVADLQPAGLQHGVLFEVPAACLAARQLMQVADFGCIGTNDLIQYLFAENRSEGDAASHSGFETDAVLWGLIQQLSRAAAAAGKSMAICGELAGNPAYTRRIMNSGITTISTSPSHIAMVRQAAEKQHRLTSQAVYLTSSAQH
jgi:phosphotransferase system enzyme I (PtsI)